MTLLEKEQSIVTALSELNDASQALIQLMMFPPTAPVDAKRYVSRAKRCCGNAIRRIEDFETAEG